MRTPQLPAEQPAPPQPLPAPAPAPAAPAASGAPTGCGLHSGGSGSTVGGGFTGAAVLPATPVDVVLALSAGRSAPLAGSIGGPVADTGTSPD